jgi:tRNA threonylcarbamoyladenosine biosynthesis protein TsaB
VSLLLNIDTSIQTASVCLAKNDIPIALKVNPSQKDSAAWLHVAIKELMTGQDVNLQQIDSIAVTEGPGSYTGLRVGMATAKGLCYALGKPLICVNTLLTMAVAAIKEEADLLCPMIDARRMEVFTAIYDKDLSTVVAPTNTILNDLSFNDLVQTKRILFFGNGSNKFHSIINHPNALFADIEIDAQNMVSLTYKALQERKFADLAYSEPFYCKDFHSTAH